MATAGDLINVGSEDFVEIQQEQQGPPKTSAQSTSHGSNGRMRKITKLRLYAFGLVFASLVVLAIMTGAQLQQFRVYLNLSLQQNAKDDLDSLAYLYEETLEIMEFEGKMLSVHPSIIETLSLAGSASAEAQNETQRLIEVCAENSLLSFVGVLAPNKTILYSSTGAMVGSTFDPNGIVSVVANSPEDGMLVCSASIVSDLVFGLGVPVVKDGDWSHRARQTLNDTYDKYGIGRFVVAPVMDSNDAFVGMVFIMEILNGNLKILEQSLTQLGDGFAGVYVKANGTVYSAMHVIYESSVVENFHWQIPSGDLNQIAGLALGTPRAEHHSQLYTLNTEGQTYYVSTNRVIAVERGGEEQASNQSQVFIVRGCPQNKLDSTYRSQVYLTLFMMAGFIVFDVLALFVAVTGFVDPLEKLVHSVIKQRMDEYDELLTKIMSKRRFVLQVGVWMACAIVFKAVDIKLYMDSVVGVQLILSDATRQASSVTYSYMTKQARMSDTSLIITNSMFVRRTAAGTGSVSDFEAASALISEQIDNWQIEYCTLVNSNRKIVISSNAIRSGQEFDPSGIVSRVLESGLRVYVSVTMPYDEFVLEGSKRFFDSFPDPEENYTSEFHPYDSHNLVVVRFVVNPVFSSSDSEGDRAPVGALVIGDIVNGKAYTVSMVQDEYSDVGFTALYYHFEKEGEAEIEFPLSTIYSPYGKAENYIYDLDDESIHSLLDKSLDEQKSATGLLTIRGETLNIYVDRIDDSWEIDKTLHRNLLSEYYPDVYFARGVSLAPYDKFKQSQLAISLTAFFIVLLALVVISVTLYVPIYRFSLKLQKSLRSHSSVATFDNLLTKVKDKVQKVTGGGSGNKNSSRNSDKESNKKTVSTNDRMSVDIAMTRSPNVSEVATHPAKLVIEE
eukprot:TRINITY_DN356_c0_g1_i1.p1 TRINITY_DN356_c0_g1~~TRINITY_DN356_c0_g1_i1.p1  ORF type:complete len:920 (-),score=244.10 TRINITY_DN356_c0_g1_i1:29-2722(-)